MASSGLTMGKICSEENCNRPHLARGLCSLHYQRLPHCKLSVAKSHKTERQRQLQRDRCGKRRALKANCFVEMVRLPIVLERDDWVCHICGEKIMKEEKFPSQRSPSLDHVIPLSKGGLHSYANVKAAHLVCNTRKGSKIV